jgi:hypothetical protein
VAAYDATISYEDVISGDVPIKNQVLIGRWRMMIAGMVAQAWPIHRRARSKLVELVRSGIAEDELSLDQVSRAVAEAYQEELKQTKADRELGGYGMSMDEFIREGRTFLGEKIYEEIFHRMEKIEFGLQLLVYGFESNKPIPNNLVHIFTVYNPGDVTSHTLVGFAAIGIGYWAAMGALLGDNMASLSEEEVIYRVCEAKFLFETSVGVGRDTYVSVLEEDGTERIIFSKQLEGVRKIWENKGRPKTSRSALTLIKKELARAKRRR